MPPSSDEAAAESSSGKIFISYRREDTQPVVGRLYDRLADLVGEERVLKDVDSIPFGADFREYSTRLVKESDVVLVLIGSQWLRRREDGTRRIDDEADLVRLEVEAAVRHCPLVIPVLVGEAAMPAVSDLPETIASLAYRNAARLRHDPDFRVDCARLLQQLVNSRATGSREKPSPYPSQPFGISWRAAPESTAPRSLAGSAPEPGGYAGEVRELGSAAISFCWCPVGTFLMGSPANDLQALEDEKPQVGVTLTEGFWLGRTAVTQGLWSAVLGTQPWKNYNSKLYREGTDYPAVFVSWEDATEFTIELTYRDRNAGRLSAEWMYALPTEAQWEYACRAGTTTRFCCGDDAKMLGQYAWYDGNTSDVGTRFAQPVGQKKANAWGLYDMHGNVWEWCRDAYSKRPGGVDPCVTTGGSARVYRGGSWGRASGMARSAHRGWGDRWVPAGNRGFRVACVTAS